mmetsp:Transcript_33987/g.79153  ORF Transcript_33987/g.79153 Transcript_33987/m.79153 type:complete len:269 (-) Transcript_33987:263-1069(-)
MASIEVIRRSRSPSGRSTAVQKNCSPPMSAAPSISTPRFPPSLMTFLSLSLRSFSFSSGVSSFSFSSGFSAFSSFALSFLPAFSLGAAFSFGAALSFGAAFSLAAGFSSFSAFCAFSLGAGLSLGAAFSAFSLPPFAAPPALLQSLTSPKIALNSGVPTHVLNQRIKLVYCFRKPSSKTFCIPSTRAQQTEMSANVTECPTMKVLFNKCLSKMDMAFWASSFASCVASGTSGISPIAGSTQVHRGISSSFVQNSHHESIMPLSRRFCP